MFEELPLFIGRELIVERHQHAPSKEDGICRNQPPRLIRHDDAGAISRGEACILESFRQLMGARLEIAIRQAFLLALAVGLNQTHFGCEAV